MNTQMPIAQSIYSNGFFNDFFVLLRRYFSQVVSKDEETPRIILRSPGGKNFDVTVTDAGALVVTPTVKTRV